MKRTKTLFFVTLILFMFPSTFTKAECGMVEAFSLSLLSPNTFAQRCQWTLIFENQFPKIGIGVDFHESTGWENIAPRTWNYPLIDFDYIPTYAQGGYDILIMGRNWDIDWDPTGVFDTGCWMSGQNFYQYTNPAYDAILTSYLTEMDQAARINYAHQLQAILYEDLPSIAIYYHRSLFGFKESLTGIDAFLIANSAYRVENWDDPADHIIKYAIPANFKQPNIFKQDSEYDMLWMQGVYGSLFKRGQFHHLWEEEIALGYNLSSDNKNITVYLNPNAKFSDGENVTAEDVKYSYELHMTPAVGSKEYSYLNTWFASNDSIQVVNNSTLNFNLTDTYCFFQKLLSYGIIDKSSVQPLISTHGYSIFEEIPLTGNVSDALVKSCGPMKLETYDSTYSSVKLVPNQYWEDLVVFGGNVPLLEEFEILLISGKDTAVAELVAGNIDIMDSQYYPVIADFTPAGVEGVLVKEATHQEMALNMRHPVFGTGELTPVGTEVGAKAIRMAISHSIPRDIIVDQIFEGLGAPGVTPMPDACVGFDETLEPYTYDLSIAIDFMEFGGFEIPCTTTPTPTPSNTSIVGYGFLAIAIIMITGLSTLQFLRRRN